MEVVTVIRALCVHEKALKGQVIVLLNDEASNSYGNFFNMMDELMLKACMNGQESLHGTCHYCLCRAPQQVIYNPRN